MQSNVQSSIICSSQEMEATQMSINRKMNREDTHTQNELLLGHNKELNNVICSNIDGSRDYHT